MDEFIPESVEKRIREIGQQVSEGLREIYQEMIQAAGQDLQTMEEAIRALMRQVGLAEDWS
jgi:hypothetical protein